LKTARQSSVNHHKKPASARVIEMPAPAPSMRAIPVDEVMSFLRQTRSALTWSEQEMADSLKITQAEASRAIDLLELQGYVKRSSADNSWMTTIDGEAVSGSKAPWFGRERVEKALADLKNRITAVNRDRRAAFHVIDAVAFGDFLLEIPRVQPAEVGIRLVARAQADAPDHSAKGEREFLRLMRGKGGLLRLQSYQPWMSSRSHRRLV
jgi:hypothetical protein